MHVRHTRTATIILSALLSTGLVFAQSAPQQQVPENSSQAANAQASQPAHRRHFHAHPNRQARRLAKKLNLSQDQVAQIKPILVDRARQMQALHADASLAPADRHAKARAIMQDSDTKIEAVLNDTQKQQFEQLLAERRARHHHHNTDNQPGA